MHLFDNWMTVYFRRTASAGSVRI